MRVRRLRVELEPGSILRLEGPVRVTLASGSVVVNGVRVSEGAELVVQSERGASLYALDERAVVELVVGSGGSYRVEEGGEGLRVARDWLRVVEEVESSGARLVAVLAPIESGKSTLSLWLVNRLGGCYASLDAGQNELGTPGYYSAAPIQPPVLSTRDLRPAWAWLVGCNAPEHCHWPALAAASSLASFVRRECRAAVLDTDGFVEGAGIVYKATLLEALRPDAVVVIERGPWRELLNAARVYADRVVTAPPVPESLVRSRSRAERRAYRERMYRLLFQEAERLTLSLDDVTLLNAVYVAGAEPPPQGLLASLVTSRGYEIPALLESLDAARKRVLLRVAWGPRDKVVAVKLGFTRLVEWREERLPLRPYRIGAATR